ncbi:MAG TPA: PEP-CTERM sorting domain-containing protein, partial [Balneolales bacterium]|nr:PEP-CTERM sorting domain-containing protein [Balneolales bacterium]
LVGCFLCLMLLFFGASSSALAIPILPDCPGCGWYGTNTNHADGANDSDFAAYLSSQGIWGDFYEKIDDIGNGYSIDDLINGIDAAIRVCSIKEEGEPLAGTWAADAEIYFVTGKAGQGFWFQYYEGGANEGCWSTALTGQSNLQGLSHISFWGLSASVPEPTTMLLLGTGLFGLAVIGRKKFKKRA